MLLLFILFIYYNVIKRIISFYTKFGAVVTCHTQSMYRKLICSYSHRPYPYIAYANSFMIPMYIVLACNEIFYS